MGEVISTDMCQDRFLSSTPKLFKCQNLTHLNYRMKKYEEVGMEHYYFLTLDGTECIDASQRGNMARFINHSCNPNAKTQKWCALTFA